MKMVGYPTKKTMHSHPGLYLGNKGMNFEEEINESNEYYIAHDIALVYKKPTPIQIVKVNYPSRNKAKIVEAYFKTPSTTDYNGIYKGRPIDFEAKQIQSKVSFPLQFIHPHQVEHLRRVIKHGGIGFVLLRFTAYQETYLIDAADVIEKYDDVNTKSLTYTWVKEAGYQIKDGYKPRLNYIDVVDKVYFKGE